MSRFAHVGLILALLPVAACSSMGNTATTTPAPMPAAPPALPAADMAFLTTAANAGEGEIELGKLALSKTHRIGIHKFADTMVTDHTLVGQQLAQIASQKGVTLTPTLSPSDADMLKQLQGESGLKFDSDYIHSQVAAHQQAVALFQQESTSGTDPDLKRLATDTLKQLQMHLKLAMTEARTEDRLARRHH